ncbi:lipid kinase, partial [Bacillus subtilis]
IETDPQMKVDIDGEINLKTPLEIEVIPNAIQILTLPEAQATNQPESE